MKNFKKSSLFRVFRNRFYSRLMLINAAIFIAISLVFGIFAFDYARRLVRVEKLQQNRDALNDICNFYDRKHDEFINLLFYMYEDPGNYDVISRFLESKEDTPYVDDPYIKQDIANIMRKVADRDNDIAMILMYKNLTGAQYVYNNNYRTIELVEGGYPFLDQLKDKSLGRAIYGTRFGDMEQKRIRYTE